MKNLIQKLEKKLGCKIVEKDGDFYEKSGNKLLYLAGDLEELKDLLKNG